MNFVVRRIDPASESEVALVATRMRDTLIEVLGEQRGGEMYSHEWLVDRVQWHLDPSNVVGEVYVSEQEDGEISGHTILRVQSDELFGRHGLFSTFYVLPRFRNTGIAAKFVEIGEKWMRDNRLQRAMTYTAIDNERLQGFLKRRGYEVVLEKDDMVALSKNLTVPVEGQMVQTEG